MDGLSVDDLMNFVKSLKSELYVEGLVQGNFTSAVSSIPQMCPVLIMELKQRNFFVYLFWRFPKNVIHICIYFHQESKEFLQYLVE